MMIQSENKNRKHLAFGIVFIIAGLVPACMLLFAIWNYRSSQFWERAQASILSVELNPGGNHKSTSSLDLLADYEYEWNGQTYRNSDVSPFHPVEILNQHKRKLAVQLRNAKRLKKTVPCFVNPQDPKRAYLELAWRWPSVLLFSTIGIVFTGAGVLILRNEAKAI